MDETLAGELKQILPELRAIAGQFGFRPFAVEVVVRSYSIGDALKGYVNDTSSEVVTPITEDGYNPKVRWLQTSDYFRGAHPDAELEVGPITPTTLNGGYSFEDLEQLDAENGTEVFYRVYGAGMPQDGGKFVKVAFNGERTLGYKIQLKRASNE